MYSRSVCNGSFCTLHKDEIMATDRLRWVFSVSDNIMKRILTDRHLFVISVDPLTRNNSNLAFVILAL